jgi:hypothetical protein
VCAQVAPVKRDGRTMQGISVLVAVNSSRLEMLLRRNASTCDMHTLLIQIFSDSDNDA